MASEDVLQARLTEAEDALHRLNTGAQEAVVSYDGHRTEYSAANIGNLQRYVRSLKKQLGQTVARGVRRVTF